MRTHKQLTNGNSFIVELDIEGIFTRQAKDFALDFLLLQESDGIS